MLSLTGLAVRFHYPLRCCSCSCRTPYCARSPESIVSNVWQLLLLSSNVNRHTTNSFVYDRIDIIFAVTSLRSGEREAALQK